MNKTIKFPIFITRGICIFPKFTETVEVGRKQTQESTKTAIAEFEGKIIVVSQRKVMDNEPAMDELFDFGTLATIKIIKTWKDGTLTVEVTGEERIKLISTEQKDGYFMASAEILEADVSNIEGQVDTIHKQITEIASLSKDFPEVAVEWLKTKSLDNINYVVDSIAKSLPFISLETRNILLGEQNFVKRLEEILNFLGKKDVSLDVDSEINKKLKDRMDQQQKEYYLREKMRIIKDELNDEDSDKSAVEKYKDRLEKEPFPKQVKERILSSISKLENMQSSSAEATVERNYIDWMMSLPWWQSTEDIADLRFAQEILDKHHYGLKKVKDRIIEFLAVKQKTKSLKGPIITLVGPPGVGKTSLAKSIAEALGKNFVKISLGGVKDESEIRGHRKTYIGAMPGRIIQTMKRAKVKNPLFLLDEIDKMASDQRGDPASAMLEVLDPEQNVEFSDHYIEEPYDLSEVMFIATANYPEDIPEALYDRMEIINLSSYTEIEKMKIAKDYLVERVLKEHSLTKEELMFTDESFDEIIKYYTREAGVRQLERHISAIARKFIVKLLNMEIENLVVTPAVINEFLGKRIFDHTEKQGQSNVGVVTGLAYTQFGGDILPIEVNVYPGKGNLTLTGKLGEVMKESATIALTYVKSNYEKFGIDKAIFETSDIHIHVPEGAVPKDGPSAGITMTTALVSALSNKPVSRDLGMTGEITLTGSVLPIGGLREKSISAARSGLKKILVPVKNLKDLDEIPDEVKSVLEIKGMETYDQVFDEVFTSN
ncbi:endopeptidase La [Mesoplasma syrphidae]|uniref:Lon protease n=1 Tax=Mesoplasma syrphidae TaxID=225999 RepID=A0A2K9C9C3_9MOLU|nr:endopeptidase La [Mesoplasma syrphidae]AUF83625.1 endopeptidase La [Mesoplasma syrphidae]